MEVIIDTSAQHSLNWAAKGVERIAQNILNLITTWRYEISYDRTKGLDTSISDKPANIAASMYIAEIYRLIDTYEPRATVKEVISLGVDNDGKMQFQVVVDI